MRLAKLLCMLALLLPASAALAQTGKISGQVTDAAAGDPLPGVNVVIDGTTQGTITDVDGYYTIVNVRPGTYDVRASFIGYAPSLVQDVRVNIDLTANVDFALQSETVGLDEVVVSAARPIVQRDVSANVANLDPANFENLPVAGISEVIDLQAGIEPGLQIRGGGANEIAFVVDGLNTRTGRNNSPITNISYTSIEETQVQTGGFSAEYGNVRAGIVNVATKEPPRNRYTFDGLVRLSPAQDKTYDALTKLPENCDYSGSNIAPDCDTWWARPVLDPAVRDVGVQAGGWDFYQRRQYYNFDGWNSVTDFLKTKGFDVTPNDMIEYWKYTHRKDNTIADPEYDIDATLGGPLIPGLSEKLGGLRFLASYRGTQNAYLYPQARNTYNDQTLQLKLISNIAPGMRVTLHGLRTAERGITPNADASQVEMYSGWMPAYPWSWSVNQIRDLDIRGDEIYTDAQYAPSSVDHNMFGARFTHTLNASTFYEVGIQRVGSKYRSSFPNLRDGSYVCPESGSGPDGSACRPGTFVNVLFTNQQGTVNPGFESQVTCFGGSSDITGDGAATPYCVGDEPFGFAAVGGNLETSESTGGHWVKTRDTSDVQVWTGRFDLTSQVNHFLQIKTGAELIYSNYDMHYALVNLQLVGPEPEQDFPWQRSPIQGAAYAQSKLEFKGMVANLGLRMDYFDANTEWWDFDPYSSTLRYRVDVLDQELPKQAVDAQLALSPRIGISFPITDNSKLYFNYGHFRQMLNASDIFGVRQSRIGGIDVIGNPNHPMPKTVAYELGFDQNLFDQFLLRISGFYRDIRDQARDATYHSLGDVVTYDTKMPWNYEDVRGFEVSLSKNRGQWVQGFANFTYLQRKEGNFGYRQFYENSFDMLNFILTNTEYRLSVPIAEPFARVNLLLLTPNDFGPQIAGAHPLGRFRLSLLSEWRRGQTFTYTGPGGNPNVSNNVRMKDYYNFDMRFTKHLAAIGGSNIQLMLDIDNVFNIKRMYTYSGGTGAFLTGSGNDWHDYMQSLHMKGDLWKQLPEETTPPYVNIPGKDRPGDYRKEDVAFQPIEAVSQLPESVDPDRQRAWWWTEADGYNRYVNGSWQKVPQGEVDKVLDEKAYIDMPNHRFHTFLWPRQVTFGIRVSF